jgi:hypothetical protein
MLIVGAIQWISSGGDKQGVETARGKVTSALIGLVILLAVFAILQLINTFFNVQILNLTIPTLNGSSGGTGSGQIPCVPVQGKPCPI